jgi:hypothetical protein
MLKLTMVSISAHGKRITRFLQLPADVNGRAHLPGSMLNRMLDELGCRRGDTFSVG